MPAKISLGTSCPFLKFIVKNGHNIPRLRLKCPNCGEK
jgi:hypothetical protein